jgi:hypothetical protein
MIAARVVVDPPGAGRLRSAPVLRIVTAALALSLLAGGLRPARASGEGETGESKVGVVMAVVCGYALKFALPAPIPFAGIAVVSCGFAFIDAALSP